MHDEERKGVEILQGGLGKENRRGGRQMLALEVGPDGVCKAEGS